MALAFGSHCIGVTAQPGNHEPSPVQCSLSSRVPARIDVQMDESPNFQIMHRGTFDNSDIEVKTMDAIAAMLQSHIKTHPYLESQQDAPNTVRITLKRIDSGADRSRSQGSELSAFLGCLTLYVFPYSSETEEFFEIDVLQDGNKIGGHRYRFHRVKYLSWLMIPFQIFYGFHNPRWGMVSYEIDYDVALADLQPVIEQDLTSLLCRLQSGQTAGKAE